MTTSNPGRRRPTPAPTHAPLEPPHHDADATNRHTHGDPTQGRVVKSPSTNLALPRSPLVGRDHQLAAVQQLLLQEEVGLLTLTGPGGIGKTRLALQVAINLLDHFVDGVYFVSLAPIREPELVSAAIAQTLGMREVGGRPLQESLHDYLRDKQLLLVLDNFEQVVAAAPVVGTLLTACRRLKALVTSRTTLHLYGEHEFPVPPLALPDPKRLVQLAAASVTSLAQYAAVDLFCQRAVAVKPDFALTATNAADVAQICIGLDGLPLAIELAAARLKLFSPSALLARLQQRLALLTGGPHDLPARQRTLRDEIAWSYDLLAPGEQTLFRRLAVFVGGFTLEAAQAVGDGEDDRGVALLDGVTVLMDQNLLKQMQQSGGEPRFSMLETIGEYGLEQLAASDEAEEIRRQHADFFLALAEATAPTLREEQAKGLARLTVEHANLRTALAWSLREANATELALRLTAALLDFWHCIGYWTEGRQWFDAALARTTAADRTIARAHALISAGALAVMQGDHATAPVRLEEGLVIARERGSKRLIAFALTCLGFVAHAQQDDALAAARHREAMAIGREIGDKYEIASNLCHLATLARDEQDYTGAQSLYEESLVFFQELGAEWDTADVLSYLGQLARVQGNYGRAEALYRESLTRWRVLGTLQWKGVVECLVGLAHIGVVQQQWAEAAHLFGAADVLRQALSPLAHNTASAEVTALRTQLDEATFAVAWAEGRARSSEQAIDYALALPDMPASAPAPVLPPPATYPAGLTTREVEVLRLLAHGLTYIQIAEKLIISRRTVNRHLTTIYTKLNVTSRHAATRFALDHHLV
jgi:predicted ATPase/DNA-binding CsgD family transcriptional regulator